jgi:hypothetical protein
VPRQNQRVCTGQGVPKCLVAGCSSDRAPESLEGSIRHVCTMPPFAETWPRANGHVLRLRDGVSQTPACEGRIDGGGSPRLALRRWRPAGQGIRLRIDSFSKVLDRQTANRHPWPSLVAPLAASRLNKGWERRLVNKLKLVKLAMLLLDGFEYYN